MVKGTAAVGVLTSVGTLVMALIVGTVLVASV